MPGKPERSLIFRKVNSVLCNRAKALLVAKFYFRQLKLTAMDIFVIQIPGQRLMKLREPFGMNSRVLPRGHEDAKQHEEPVLPLFKLN